MESAGGVGIAKLLRKLLGQPPKKPQKAISKVLLMGIFVFHRIYFIIYLCTNNTLNDKHIHFILLLVFLSIVNL